MNRKQRALSVLLLIFTLAISCTEEKKAINPNGDSELALLMRAMYDEAQLIKTQIENGEPVQINLDHEAILTAHATEPEKAGSEAYQAYAQAYLESVKNLQDAAPEQLVSLYDHLVNNCMVCHKALCPGPIVKIKKLQ